MEKKKINIPQKGAGRKWAKYLEELGKRAPPEELMKKINEFVGEPAEPGKDIKLNTEKKSSRYGAIKKWSEMLSEIGEQAPPDELMDLLNKITKS